MGTDVDQQDTATDEVSAPPVVATPRPAWRSTALGGAVTAAPYAVAALVTTIAALWTYQPWRLDGAIAFPRGDSLSFHAWILSTMESGWYESSERLAAPAVQNGHTYVVTDELLFALVGRVLGPLTGTAGAAVLWWVVLSFPVAALLAVGLARYLGLGRLAAIVPGILFPLIPDHFLRATGHYSLSSMWAVPLGLWIAVSLLHRPRHTGRRRVAFEVAMLAGCVAIALTNAYYATFTALLVAAAGVGGALAARSWRVLLTGVVRGLALVVPIAVAIWVDNRLAPQLVGYTSFAITRSASDSETYAGKIFAMLLPSTDHRWQYFRDVRNQYLTIFPNPAENPALGAVAAVSFVGLVLWSILHYWRRPTAAPADERLTTLAGLNWFALLGYSVGGIGTAWAFLLDGGGIRVWSRFHTFIALIVLLALAVALERVSRRWLQAVVVVLVLAVGIVDQTSWKSQPHFDEARSLADEMTELTAAVAEREGAEAAIFQYPQVSFPVHNRHLEPASPYDNFLPFLYSEGLRWSFGGYQGEPSADWQEALVLRPLDEQAGLLAAGGFSGALVDVVALTPTPEVREEIAATFGEPDLVSTSGRWEYYDLNSEAPACDGPAADVVEDEAVRPPVLYAGDNAVLQSDFVWRNDEGQNTMRVLTLREGGWDDVDVSFHLRTPTTSLVITLPDGSVRRIAAGSDTMVEWSGAVPEDGADIRVERGEGAGPYVVDQMQALPDEPGAAACALAWQSQALTD